MRRVRDAGQRLRITRHPEPEQADTVAFDPLQFLGEVRPLPRLEDAPRQLGADERHLLEFTGAGAEHLGCGPEVCQQRRGQPWADPRNEMQRQQVLNFR
jgi:hypothetical protein